MPDTDIATVGGSEVAATVGSEAEDFLAKRIPIKFFQVGKSRVEPLEVAPDTTLADLLREKELGLKRAAVMYQGKRATDLTQVLEPGSLVVYAKNVKGGR